MKKKLVSLLLATTMVAGLAGCGGSMVAPQIQAQQQIPRRKHLPQQLIHQHPVIQLLLKQQILILLSM